MYFETNEDKTNKNLIYKIVTLNALDYEKIKGKIIIDVKTKVHSERERKHVGRSLNTHTRW